MSRVLLVDDDEAFRTVMRQSLQVLGHEVRLAANGNEALPLVRRGEVDLVITDIFMPEREGLETIRDVRRANRSLPIIAVSGGSSVCLGDYLELARRLGAGWTLAKPFSLQELSAVMRQALPAAPEGGEPERPRGDG